MSRFLAFSSIIIWVGVGMYLSTSGLVVKIIDILIPIPEKPTTLTGAIILVGAPFAWYFLAWVLSKLKN